MIEQKALAYVNMYGILGSLENLCQIDSKAKKVLTKFKKPTSICFNVKGGPCCTFEFSKDGCVMRDGDENCNMKMNFSTCEKFNALINDSTPGIPVKDPVGTLLFLLGPFTSLTNRLNELLRPSKEAMADKAFFEENTIMTMYVIAGAVSALANNDSISKISAGNTVDGSIRMSIPGKAEIGFKVDNHVFTTVKGKIDNPRAIMEFADIELANGLFNGTVSTINEMCKGSIKLAGMISMIDNINRILDRVSVYLS